MTRAWFQVLAVGLLATVVPNDALAFCQATTVDENQAMCGQVGEPLWWPTACLSYAVDEDGSQWLDQAETRAVVEAGFNTWSSVTCDTGPTEIQFRRLADSTCMIPEYNFTGGNVNTIAFLDPWVDPRDGVPLNSRALGFTSVWFDTETGEIWGADMLINDAQRLADCSSVGVCSGFDLESIVTHEAGHFIGIGHSPITDATMYLASGSVGDIEMRSLEQDDIDAICTIYPPGSLQSNCNDSDFTPRGGLDLNCEDDPNTGGGGCSTAVGESAVHTWVSALLCLGLFVWVRRRTF